MLEDRIKSTLHEVVETDRPAPCASTFVCVSLYIPYSLFSSSVFFVRSYEFVVLSSSRTAALFLFAVRNCSTFLSFPFPLPGETLMTTDSDAPVSRHLRAQVLPLVRRLFHYFFSPPLLYR